VVENSGVQRLQQHYDVAIHGRSSGITLVPSSLVDSSCIYRPSREVEKQIGDMWNFRRPRAIGSTSEMMGVEILHGALVGVDGADLLLTCEKLRSVPEVSAVWKPDTGIYSDDLIAVAESNRTKLLFLTEVKGTTLQQGLSHSTEAKMFYQLARTYHALLDRVVSSNPSFVIRGVITIAITHYQRKITLNVLNGASALGFFPDDWLYKGRWRNAKAR